MVAHREDCEAVCLIGMLGRHTLGSGKTPQRRLAPLGPSWRGFSWVRQAKPTVAKASATVACRAIMTGSAKSVPSSNGYPSSALARTDSVTGTVRASFFASRAIPGADHIGG